jgi:hypothetical protein
MTTVAAISLAAGVAWSAGTDASLEHRLDGPHAASIQQSATEQRAIETNAPDEPSWREPGRASIVTAAMVPVSPEPELRGPRMTSSRETPRARGGGPAPSVQRFSTDEVGTARGLVPVGASTVSAPLGCSRVEAVGAPRVRSVDVTVTNERGQSVAHAQQIGRLAVVSFCPRDDGQYFVTARAVGGTVADPVQVFVE